jgi:hypothetical protein
MSENNPKTKKRDEQPGQETTEDEEIDAPEIEEDYKRKTIYLQENTKKKFNLWLNQMESEHEFVYDSGRKQQYEALIHVAMNHEDEFLDELQDVMGQV